MTRILIVDDEPINLKILAPVLEELGYHVHAARSGHQALDAVARREPDLILLDLIMPDMDGLETCRRLKAIPALVDVPVIFLTAMHCDDHVVRGLEAGAVDYITKPFNPAVLRARVKTHLKLREKTLLLEDLANRDGLTGLHNRRAFDRQLDSEWRRCRRSAGLGLLILDIDYFKVYNDSYGHLQGDEALKAVADAIDAAAHRAGDFTARYGGEEFAVISANDDPAALLQLGQRLCWQVAALEIPHAGSLAAPTVTISIGGSWQVPQNDNDTQGLIAAADKKLYAAKEQGRNRVICEP